MNYNYNPMLDYKRNQLLAEQAMIQNQLNAMNKAAPISQFSPHPQQSQSNFFVRQVGNMDEARAYPADPGIMYFFLDTGSGKIYLKQLNSMNGKSDFYVYSVQEQEIPQAKADPFEQINARLTNIEKLIGGIYDKPISGITGDEQPNGGNAEANSSKNAGSKSSYVPASPADDKRKK